VALSNLISAASMTATSRYWINSTGTTDFREYGAASNAQGTEFVAAAGSSFTYAGSGTVFSGTPTASITSGNEYMISTVGGTTWTDYGFVGTASQYAIFTASQSATMTGGGLVYPTRTLATAMTSGNAYFVGARGSTDFTRYGSTSNNPGTAFTASYATLARAGTGTLYGLVAATAMMEGSQYRIYNPTGTTFTNYGASANTAGTVFTATYPKGTGTVKPIITVPNMVAGTGYTIYVRNSSDFTKYGSANNTAGTTFTAALPLISAAGTGTTTTAVTTSAQQWQDHAFEVDPTTDSAGLNVKMAVDKSGGIHLAYYSAAGGDLKYAYLASHTDSTFRLATVDSFLSVGTNICIDVAKDGAGNQVPYISYSMPAAFGTTASAKMAYRVRFTNDLGQPNTVTGQFNGATNDLYTQNWEVSPVPSAYTPADSNVNVAVFRDPSGTLAAIPPGTNTVTTDTSANGWPVSPGRRIFGNGTLNPAVSYAVNENGILEMAQKK
jgi:hypothetical protein